MKKIILIIIILFQLNSIYCQEYIEFNTINWKTNSENIIDFDGRKCLSWDAELKNVLFENGVIEMDIWSDGDRSYPGIIFRDQENGNYEILYLRPHRSGLYDDAVQYAPSFNNTICWQLYHGKGCTSNAEIKKKQWVHLKIEVSNNITLFYLDDNEKPLLEINLAHDVAKGKIKLRTWNKNTFFSNFKLQKQTDYLTKIEHPKSEKQINSDWEISKLLDKEMFDADYPRFYKVFSAGWQKVQTDNNGLVNITKYRKIKPQKKNCVYGRRLLYSDENKKVKMAFGYSDAIKIYLNERLLYSGNYAYRSRGNSFTGTIGLSDTLYLDLQKGLNELFVISKDNFGGWGFNLNIDEKHLLKVTDTSELLENTWSTPENDLLPESAVYDSTRKAIYYTNFDNQYSKHKLPKGYITKCNLNGDVINSKWVDSLYAPCGMCMFNDKLYVVERTTIVEISLPQGKIIKRYNFSENVDFPNDIATDGSGNLYITNTSRNPTATDIFALTNNEIVPWIVSDELSRLNGIYYDEGNLFVGNSGETKFQKVDISSKQISTIASLGRGIIDGIKKDRNGDFLVSLWEGELYKINKVGKISQLLYSIGDFNIADFEYIKELDCIVIPTFLGKNIRTYKLLSTY